MCKVLDYFKITQHCKIGKKIFKKHFSENFALKVYEKKILQEDIQAITLEYLLNSNNINIEPFINDEVDFGEVALISVVLLDNERVEKVAKIIQNIPYPIVLIISHEDRFCIHLAYKRINQKDSSKVIISDEYVTPWMDIKNLNIKEKKFLESLDLKNQSFTNFEKFYSDLINKVIALKLSKETSSFVDPKDTNKEILDNISTLEIDIKELKSLIKRETHFNEKVNLNIKLKVLYDKLDKIKGELCTS